MVGNSKQVDALHGKDLFHASSSRSYQVINLATSRREVSDFASENMLKHLRTRLRVLKFHIRWQSKIMVAVPLGDHQFGLDDL